MEQIQPGAHAAARAKQVFEVEGPAIDERLARYQAVDQIIPFVGIPARAESSERRPARARGRLRREKPGAGTRRPAASAGVRNSVAFHAAEDRFINIVAARNFRLCAARVRAALRTSDGDFTGDFGFVRRRLKHRAMRAVDIVGGPVGIPGPGSLPQAIAARRDQ